MGSSRPRHVVVMPAFQVLVCFGRSHGSPSLTPFRTGVLTNEHAIHWIRVLLSHNLLLPAIPDTRRLTESSSEPCGYGYSLAMVFSRDSSGGFLCHPPPCISTPAPIALSGLSEAASSPSDSFTHSRARLILHTITHSIHYQHTR